MILDGLAQLGVLLEGQLVKAGRLEHRGRIGERPVSADAAQDGRGNVVIHACVDNRAAGSLLEDDHGVNRLAVGPP